MNRHRFYVYKCNGTWHVLCGNRYIGEFTSWDSAMTWVGLTKYFKYYSYGMEL